MARLDRLPQVRELAQLGSVLGREFAYEMISGLSTLGETMLQEGLGQLVETELLYQRGRPPRARYVFKHALVQDAAYRSLLRRTRQQYHRQVAELLETRFPGDGRDASRTGGASLRRSGRRRTGGGVLAEGGPASGRGYPLMSRPSGTL